jgi:MFS family permease
MHDSVIQTKKGRFVLRSAQRRRSIRAAIFTAMSHTIGAACLLTGTLQLFSLNLGADDLFLGLLTCSVWAGAPFLLAGLPLMRRFGKRRILVFWAGIMPAICTAAMAITPFAGHYQWLTNRRILILLLVASLMRSVSDNIGAAGWFPVLHDNVPSRITGKFFGIFRMYWQFSGLLATLLIAWFLGSDPAWWKFSVVFVFGQFCFIAKIHFLRQLKEKPIPSQTENPPHPLKVLYQAITIRKSRYFLAYILLYNIAVFMPLPFQIKYLNELGYSDGYIIAANSMIGIGALLSLRFWGKLADRFGNRSVFTISHIGMMITLLGWLLVDNNAFSAVFVFILYVFWSIFQSANGIAQIRYMFHSVPEHDQSHMVIINVFISLSVALAPLSGGLFLWLASGWNFQSGALSFNHYHMLFIICSLIIIIPHNMRQHFSIGNESSTSEVFVLVTRPLRMMFGSFASFKQKQK